MKTIDGLDYKPGMTLYASRDGVVTAVRTQERTDRLPESAIGTDDRLHFINGYYGYRDNAYVVATNYWLHLIRGAEAKLSALNKERDAELYESSRRLLPVAAEATAALDDTQRPDADREGARR